MSIPNQQMLSGYGEIDLLLSQSVFFYDPFYPGSWSGTPADNDPIGTFNDRYGRATWQLTQATGGSQPLYQANSGKPYLLFDGVDDVLLTGTIDSTSYFPQTATLIVTLNSTSAAGTNQNAVKYVGGNAATRILGLQVNSQKPTWLSGGLQNSTIAYSTFKVFAGTRVTGTGTKKLYTNGTLENSGDALDYTHQTESMFVGAFRNTATYNAFQGGIGEVAAWGTALSASEVNLISQFFIQRRGL